MIKVHRQTGKRQTHSLPQQTYPQQGNSLKQFQHNHFCIVIWCHECFVYYLLSRKT